MNTSPSPPTLATWVVPVHGLVAAAMVLAGVLWPDAPAWLAPALVLAGALVFVLGVALYLAHRDRWSKDGLDAAWAYLEDQVGSIDKLLRSTTTSLPANLAERLEALETGMAGMSAASSTLAGLRKLVEISNISSKAPVSPLEPSTAAPPPGASPNANSGPAANAGAALVGS